MNMNDNVEIIETPVVSKKQPSELVNTFKHGVVRGASETLGFAVVLVPVVALVGWITGRAASKAAKAASVAFEKVKAEMDVPAAK